MEIVAIKKAAVNASTNTTTTPIVASLSRSDASAVTADAVSSPTIATPIANGSIESNEHDWTTQRVFQAIGTITGKPFVDDSGKYGIVINDQTYGLFVLPRAYRKWKSNIDTLLNTNLTFRVYPKVFFAPPGVPSTTPYKLGFEVLSWSEDANSYKDFENIEQPGHFRLKGFFQFIPQCKSPVISVYRNKSSIDPKERFKASHVPIIMRREDAINPFKFDPKIPKEDLPPRYFVSGLFKFSPRHSKFLWAEDINPPSTKFPTYIQPMKVA